MRVRRRKKIKRNDQVITDINAGGHRAGKGSVDMQKIFENGTIITMEESCPSAEAILVEDDIILKVGSREEIFESAQDGAKVVDLKGRTLMPGFFDAHGHFILTAMAQLSFVDVRCVPVGSVRTIAQMIQVMKNSPQAKKGKGAIVGFGYDDTLIEDGRMAEASDLDQVSDTRPVILIHTSFHLVMANSVAMKDTGTDAPDFNPKGGVVRRRNGKAIGVFEEMAAAGKLMELAYSISAVAGLAPGMGDIVRTYLKNGVTTICEGANGNDMAKMVKIAMNTGQFPARYILCPSLTDKGEVPPRIKGKRIINGPVKLLMDGSIQCYTAALSQPYATQAPAREGDKEYKGFTHMSVEELRSRLETILDSNRSFAIHSNGDAALDQIMEALEGCRNLNKNNYKRNLIIHCQTAREDQLDKMKTLNLYPSFFPAHIYVWGDRHYSTFLGAERAERLDPVGSAVKKDLIFSLHNDSPVTQTNPLELVWNAVTRKTQGGRILGVDQRVSVEEALKGITINAAYQYKVEDILGSISEGKRADLVALDKNPLEVEPDEIKDIKVERVWVDGEIVWSNIFIERGVKSREI